MTDRVLGIDPGFPTSGLSVVANDGYRFTDGRSNKRAVYCNVEMDNEDLIRVLELQSFVVLDQQTGEYGELFPRGLSIYIEKLVPYGQSVAKETFETIMWSGRFYQSALRFKGSKVACLSRPDIKKVLFGATTYRDEVSGEVKGVATRQLKEIVKGEFEPLGGGADAYKGIKSKPGPLYIVKGSHGWDALIVAIAGTKL